MCRTTEKDPFGEKASYAGDAPKLAAADVGGYESNFGQGYARL